MVHTATGNGPTRAASVVMRFKAIDRIVTFRIFDETEPLAWLVAAAGGLAITIASYVWSSFQVPFELLRFGPLAGSLLALSLAFLTAHYKSKQLQPRLFRGILAFWLFAMVAMVSAIALEPQAARVLFSISAIALSFVFQGPRRLFLAIFVAAVASVAVFLGADLGIQSVLKISQNPSLATLLSSFFLASLIFCLRTALTDALKVQKAIGQTSRDLEVMKKTIALSQESVQLARERLWEKTLPQTESYGADVAEMDSPSDQTVSHRVSFQELVSGIRKQFADFQTEGRADGRISGPIRFVFFAPLEGSGLKDKRELLVHADLESLKRGVNAILWLSLESLPETGQRRREGVIRLSVRSGLGSVEITVEDNGRGIASPNPANENEYRSFKESVLEWNGRMERVSKLGVGSRTEMELKLLTERSRSAGAPRVSSDHQWRPKVPEKLSDQPGVG